MAQHVCGETVPKKMGPLPRAESISPFFSSRGTRLVIAAACGSAR
jgi:hypothetical protein